MTWRAKPETHYRRLTARDHELLGTRPEVEAKRECLRCGRLFRSRSIENRMCGPCKQVLGARDSGVGRGWEMG